MRLADRRSGSKLPSVLLRVALLAVLRSQRLNGLTIGVMVTASHNPEPVSRLHTVHAPLHVHRLFRS